MAKSVAHMMLYKNTSRLGQRKVDLKEQCRRRLSNIRLDNFSKNRPNLHQELSSIISSTLQADSELTFEEQIQLSEELFQEIWEEEIKSCEESIASRAEEEAAWMESMPIRCPNCHQTDVVFDSTTCNDRCSSPLSIQSQNGLHFMLYDDDLDIIPTAKPSAPVVQNTAPPPEPSEYQYKEFGANISMKFLQSQIQAKRNSIQSGNLLQSVPKPLNSGVVDLTGRSRAAPVRSLRPMTAKAVPDSALPMFINKAAVDDSVHMFGEITIEKEYQPAVPNDYYFCKKRKDEQEAREKAARDIAERLEKEHKEEMKKREKGAAFAPPTFFESEPVVEIKREPEPSPSPKFALPAAPFKPFGQSGRGLGVAASIMSKMGYKEGFGLGRDEQGISTAITLEKTGKSNMGTLIAPEQSVAPPAPMSQQAISDAMKNATRIVVLKNMVGQDEVDDELADEIREEMTKYGQITTVHIHKMSNPKEGDEVRIFVEFTNVAQAIKAFIVQSGRFFAGRPVLAAFYPDNDFNDKIYE
ncbi:hypothetical protein PFISCL1PPCAC_14908 [Pristionchus fissidentatus]|uniref:G-patch domain-containing protein n=1 Tax=Pristionchus fissidentatus TaxID=1538716 RepID=A0AAV5VV63_9BILA|nr:hypothetical protein PFISCL1PPCAC_14908 [Pristionchus fissidentatus]